MVTVKSHKIVDDHPKQGGDETKEESQADIIFFKHQSFQVFCNLSFKT